VASIFEIRLIDPGPSAFSRTPEVTADGKIAYTQQLDGALNLSQFSGAGFYTALNK